MYRVVRRNYTGISGSFQHLHSPLYVVIPILSLLFKDKGIRYFKNNILPTIVTFITKRYKICHFSVFNQSIKFNYIFFYQTVPVRFPIAAIDKLQLRTLARIWGIYSSTPGLFS
jgi:hypothetical protein